MERAFIRRPSCGNGDWYLVREGGVGRPCFVFLHGHGSGGDQLLKRADIREGWTAFLVRNGFSVISPNLGGNSWMSPAAAADLAAILRREKEILRWDRLFVVGGSMGGSAALIFARLHPELVDGVAALGAAPDPAAYMDWLVGGTLPVHADILAALRRAYPDGELARAHSAVEGFEALRGKPVVLIHAADDAVMPATGASALAARLSDDPAFLYEELPAGGHDAPLARFQSAAVRLLQLTSRRDWRRYREEKRHSALPGDPFAYRPYSPGLYWEGRYLMENPPAGESMAVRRARAFSYLLENIPLSIHPDQEFFGDETMLATSELPAGLDEAEYREKEAFFREHGNPRPFAAGSSHVAPDYARIVAEGLGGYLRRAEEAFARSPSPAAEAMLISVRALSRFFLRAADFCETAAPEASWRLRRLATEPPADFAEAIQLVWLVHVAIAADGNRPHNALARLDQTLLPPLRAHPLPESETLRLLCHLWTGIEGTHQVVNICIGGLRPDGSDASNELSRLMLKATGLVHSASTNLSARLSRKTPDAFLLDCIDLIRTGIGFPAVFNDEVNVPMLRALGIPEEDARGYALFGCVEPLVAGRQVAWSDGRFSMPEIFLDAVRELPRLPSFEALFDTFAAGMARGMKEYAAKFNARLEACDPVSHPDPVLSAFVGDCIGRGRDINDGGADFPRFHGVGMMGLATIVDSLAAVRKLVFEERRVAPERLLRALDTDFAEDPELLQILLHCAPKYGNDTDECNALARRVVELCGRVCLAQPMSGGGFFLSCMASNISNIPAGAALGATPDGRRAGAPLSDAASPTGGRDICGPTAFVNSIVSPDYTSQACTVVNMRIQPELFDGEDGRRAMLALLRRFIEEGGQEMQFNVTSDATLRDAMEHPERHGDLIVRVSGFSAFFTRLSPEVQRDIARRTAHHGR